jgi:hypothetical protein
MRRKAAIAAIVLVVVVGLLLTAHTVDFMGIVKRMHGG